MTTNKRPCKGTIFNGSPCSLPAQKEKEYCYQHDPEKPVKQAQVKTIKKLEEAGRKMQEQMQEQVQEQVIPQQVSPEFTKFEIAKRIAQSLAQSNLVPDAYRGRPNDVFVAINMGSELGMEPFQAIQSIAVIEGKPCLYGDGLIGVVRASPKCLWIEESISEDGLTATCRTQRDGDPNPVTATYSMTDAMQAGIDSKKNWKKHPKRMLQMRARAYCLRDAYPDLLKGLGVVEERQDHDNTPPPVTEFKLPEKPKDNLLEQTKDVLGEDAEDAPTLAEVERAMHQSDTMKELLEAGAMAKRLTPEEQGTARITYKKMRTALMDPEA
jgi:hypothetical protein